jgi:uncharacterized protein YjiS (DUF1127 family)
MSNANAIALGNPYVITRWFRSWLHWVLERQRQGSMICDLQTLPDYLLRDIGLDRSDIRSG